MLVTDQVFEQTMTDALKLVEEARKIHGILKEVHIMPDKRASNTNRFRVKIKYYNPDK